MSTFKILGAKYSYSRTESFKETERLVESAGKHGGVVFGGYVRDIIIPVMRLHRSLDDVDFKDLDFWFRDKEGAKAFIISSGLTPIDTPTKDRYPIDRNQHMSHYKSNKFVVVDVIVSDFFPVCDFSVNLVSWNGTRLEVHKPYDIVSVVANNIIKRQNKRKRSFTLDEIHDIILSQLPEKSQYTIEELVSCLKMEIISPVEEVEYRLLTKSNEFKTYTLDEIINQINHNVYDTSTMFTWMAQKGHQYRMFTLISTHAKRRIEQFEKKQLGGTPIKHGSF